MTRVRSAAIRELVTVREPSRRRNGLVPDRQL
jgi:hypothetical protein